jgi:hypothetical protein
MKSKAELKKDILSLNNRIQHEFPELSDYIKTLPFYVSDIDKEGIDFKSLERYYNTLLDMLIKFSYSQSELKKNKSKETQAFSGYPLYSPADDIYNRFKEESDLDPTDLTKKKTENEAVDSMNEKDFSTNLSGDDLDVPGSELDDAQEDVGREDEENNYYSLGGDNHKDLEEN